MQNIKDFKRAIKRIDKWLNVEKTWTFALLGLAVAGSIAVICNIFLCKYMKCLRSNQLNMQTGFSEELNMVLIQKKLLHHC